LGADSIHISPYRWKCKSRNFRSRLWLPLTRWWGLCNRVRLCVCVCLCVCLWDRVRGQMFWTRPDQAMQADPKNVDKSMIRSTPMRLEAWQQEDRCIKYRVPWLVWNCKKNVRNWLADTTSIASRLARANLQEINKLSYFLHLVYTIRLYACLPPNQTWHTKVIECDVNPVKPDPPMVVPNLRPSVPQDKSEKLLKLLTDLDEISGSTFWVKDETVKIWKSYQYRGG